MRWVPDRSVVVDFTLSLASVSVRVSIEPDGAKTMPSFVTVTRLADFIPSSLRKARPVGALPAWSGRPTIW